MYSKEKDIERENEIKIGEVGYYTLAFQRKEDDYTEEFCGDKIVVEVNDEKDYDFSLENREDGYLCFSHQKKKVQI